MHISLKIREINSFDDFLGLREDWNTFLSRCDHTVFSTWEWLTTWWRHFGDGRKLVLLIAEENGKIFGIAPLMYSVKKIFGLRTAKIEFIGTRHSDYNDFIIAGNKEECLHLFLDYLRSGFKGKWDSIELNDIPETSATQTSLSQAGGGLQTVYSRVIHECLYLPLPQSYENLYNQLSYKFRQNLRRCDKNLLAEHKVKFVDYSNLEQHQKGMASLFDLNQKRWQTKSQPGAFADPKICDFTLDIAQTFLSKGWLRLNSLSVDGIPVAVSYGFNYGSKFNYYLHGVDPNYQRYSVGNLLVVKLLKQSIEEGLTEFDFLRGDESYKYRWTSLTRKNYNLMLTKKGVIPRFQNRFNRAYSFQATKLKSRLE
jgi:CelD/BcsL family acetyltransferase involved in cellulose biosynthesis